MLCLFCEFPVVHVLPQFGMKDKKPQEPRYATFQRSLKYKCYDIACALIRLLPDLQVALKVLAWTDGQPFFKPITALQTCVLIGQDQFMWSSPARISYSFHSQAGNLGATLTRSIEIEWLTYQSVHPSKLCTFTEKQVLGHSCSWYDNGPDWLESHLRRDRVCNSVTFTCFLKARKPCCPFSDVAESDEQRLRLLGTNALVVKAVNSVGQAGILEEPCWLLKRIIKF